MKVELPEGLALASQSKRKRRVARRPKHSFLIKQYPYEITPFMIAPVLAGETLKNALLQSRAVSTPMENSLIGHHMEHYLFYVKLRDLADRDDIANLLLDMNETGVTTEGADNVYLYAKSGAIAWQQMCLDSVVDHYFRDEGETVNEVVGGTTGLPLAHFNNTNFGESMTLDSAIETDNIDGSVNPIEFDQLEDEYQTWEFMRNMQLTEKTFEEYCEDFGAKIGKEEPNKPELIRYTKNWTYPTNTVDGSGNINTQATWSIAERSDKDRFFKEPGFIFGVTVWRPKLYLADQQQAAVSVLDNALRWLPAAMKDKPMSSIQKISSNAANSPYDDTAMGTSVDYWIDIRDLFVHGDQFINYAADETDNVVSWDGTSFHEKKYPLPADLQLMGILDTLTAEQDGVVSLNILGTQVDLT